MSDSSFTFAELEYLGGAAEHWPDVRALLSLPEGGDVIAAAGLSSLLVRDLARIEGGAAQVRADVTERVLLLLRPSRVVRVSRSDDSGLTTAAFLVPANGDRTALVSLVAPGVYDLAVLKPAEDAAAQLRDVALELAEEGRAALVLGPKDGPGEILLGHSTDGVWTLGRVSDDPSRHHTGSDRAAVSGAIEQWIRSWLTR